MKPLSTFPALMVEFDSEVLAPATARTLEEIIVRQELSQPSMCELCFASLPADYLPRPGMKVVVLLGEEKSTLFSGETSAVEYIRRPGGERLVRVRAYDLLQNLRKKHSLRAYQQMTAAGLAREMASSLGVQVSAADEGPAWATLIQHNQSDFDFLRSVARRSGLFLSLRGNTLHMLALNGLEDEIELELGNTLLEAAVEMNAALANGPVTVAAWNPLRAEPHKGEAAAARSAFDGKPAADNGSVVLLANRTATDDAQASVMAQAELDLRRARSTTIVGTAEGNAALTPGSKIKVRGYPDEFANRFVLTAVTQRISRATGFISELSSRPAEPERTPEAAILACGVVSNIHDPEQLGRVRLTLPAVGGVETDWLEVLASGAGSGKGLLCLPDVGDKVAALFAREDFSAGIVIGGLFGADGLDDYGVDEKIVRFALLTPGGHKLRFDDSKKSLRVESATGSYLEFTPDKVSLHASADLEISAPGRKMMIGAEKIDFRSL